MAVNPGGVQRAARPALRSDCPGRTRNLKKRLREDSCLAFQAARQSTTITSSLIPGWSRSQR
jgi:hypothetical protein